MASWHKQYPQAPPDSPRYDSPRKPPRNPLSGVPKEASFWHPTALDYWESHGISPSFILGLSNVYPTAEGICFRLDGGGYQERLTTGEHRFRSSQGEGHSATFTPKPIVGGATRRLFIVEGPADAVALRSCLEDAVALLGSRVSLGKIQRIQRMFNPMTIYYVMDSDRAGWSGFDMFQRQWPGVVTPCMLPPGIKDFCGVSRENRYDVLDRWLYPRRTTDALGTIQPIN